MIHICTDIYIYIYIYIILFKNRHLFHLVILWFLRIQTETNNTVGWPICISYVILWQVYWKDTCHFYSFKKTHHFVHKLVQIKTALVQDRGDRRRKRKSVFCPFTYFRLKVNRYLYIKLQKTCVCVYWYHSSTSEKRQSESSNEPTILRLLYFPY
jgi:hypothetical protein